VYIPTPISLGFYRLGFAYSESRLPVRSLCLCPSSAATASASASSPATGTSGEDPFSVAKMGYVFLPICGIGLVVCPTVSGGLLPLRGSCCPASRGRCLRRQTPWFRRCDGCRPSLLACSFIVFKVHWFSDVLLMVPFKLHFLRRCGGPWSASWMAPIVGDKEDRGFFQGSECNFRFFQVCLCKMGCKLPVLLRMKIPVPLKKKIDIRIH